MSDQNKFMGTGRVSTAGELRKTGKGTSVFSFNLVSNVWNGTAEEAQFRKINCFGKLAEQAAKIPVGSNLTVFGDLRDRSWEAQVGDQTVTKKATEVFCNTITVQQFKAKATPDEEAPPIEDDDIPVESVDKDTPE